MSLDPPAPDVAPFGLLLRGYEGALERFVAAVASKEQEPTLHALFEALNWTAVLDDRVGDEWKPEGASLGWQWRKRIPGAEVLEAVNFVRNSVHHDWSLALAPVEGFSFPLQLPVVFHEWRWRAVAELPPPRRGLRPRDPAQREAYERHLAGGHARLTLAGIAALFTHMRTVLEPD